MRTSLHDSAYMTLSTGSSSITIYFITSLKSDYSFSPHNYYYLNWILKWQDLINSAKDEMRLVTTWRIQPGFRILKDRELHETFHPLSACLLYGRYISSNTVQRAWFLFIKTHNGHFHHLVNHVWVTFHATPAHLMWKHAFL